MNPITNSTIKEQMRQRNEAYARSQEQQIQMRLSSELSQLSFKPQYKFKGYGIAGAIIGVILLITIGVVGFILGFGLCVGIWFLMNQSVKNANAEVNAKSRQLQEEANAAIRREYSMADQRTQREIATYEREVNQYAQKILNKADSITPMVDHVTAMLQRMISHAESGAHVKFIEADLTYQVVNSGIKYSYQSRYSNPQDDLNFNKERYRDLNTPAECEGLAQALAKLSIHKTKQSYPPNSITMSLSHNDALVTIHFKGANKNFIPARNII